MDKFNSAKAIMIQGTMSNAGKSLIAAALCRIFRQDGYSVAPFKSQNMALNSYITAEGLEMGRAQVMQAEAAGTEPSVLMNPILLKPTSDVGSQVIVNGEVVGNMRAMEYFRRKREFVPQIMNAFSQLSARHDIIVIEGAGSPAELNLKELAAVSGNKHVEMVPLKEVQPLTGYIRGGCSPLAGKKHYPVFVDESAILHERIYVSAGHRGVQLRLAPDDLLRAVEGTYAAIARY